DHVRVLFGGKPTATVDDQAAERCRRRHALGPPADCLEKPLFEELHPGEEQVLLGREVVEDGHLGDVAAPGALGHGDRIEAAGGEQARRCLEDQLPCLLLLAFAQARPGFHACRLAESFGYYIYLYAIKIE